MIFRSGVMNGHEWMESGDLVIIVVCTLNQKSFWNSLFRSKMFACKEHILKGITFEVFRPWNGKTSERVKRGESKKASEREGDLWRLLGFLCETALFIYSRLELFCESSKPLCAAEPVVSSSMFNVRANRTISTATASRPTSNIEWTFFTYRLQETLLVPFFEIIF